MSEAQIIESVAQVNPADTERSMESAVTLASTRNGSVDHRGFGRTVKTLDGIEGVAVENDGFAVRAGGSDEIRVKDASTGTELEQDKSWGVGNFGRRTDYKAKVAEAGETINVTYHAGINSPKTEELAERNDIGWGPTDVGAPKRSGTEIVRTDKSGNEVYRHTAKGAQLAQAVAQRAAGKLIDRMQ